jgi:hypothetical protein
LVQTEIPVQRKGFSDYKNYTILYFVFEKEWSCDQYPPDGIVTFYDIAVQYDGVTASFFFPHTNKRRPPALLRQPPVMVTGWLVLAGRAQLDHLLRGQCVQQPGPHC